MEDLGFLRDAPKGDVTVRIQTNESLIEIPGISEEHLEIHVPALLKRITIQGDDKVLNFNHQESRIAVISLLRYICLQDYRMSDQLIDRPCSLLLHLQMLKVAKLYNIDPLKKQARGHLRCELEIACCTNSSAIDLVNAIRFLYLELDDEDDVKDDFGHYCVENFAYHNLGKDESFRQTIYECPSFHHLLSKINCNNDFEAEGAAGIMAMEVCPHAAHSSSSKEVQRSVNFLCRTHTPNFSKPLKEREPQPWSEPNSRSNSFVLVERPRFSATGTTVTPTSLGGAAIPFRPAATPLSRGDLDLFEASYGSDPASAGSSNVHATSSGASTYDSDDQAMADAPVMKAQQPDDSTDQSESDWSLIDAISGGDGSNRALLSAPVDCSGDEWEELEEMPYTSLTG